MIGIENKYNGVGKMNSNFKDIKEVFELTAKSEIIKSNLSFDQNYMYALTKENAKKSRNLIENDSKYGESSYKKYYKYLGKKLKDYSKEEIKTILKEIASSNSTRTSNINIDILSDYIFNNKKNFLLNLESGNVEIIDEISSIDGFIRKEKSFASKVCAYLCELEFKKSNFAVNDSVVRTILPYYLNYFEIAKITSKKLGSCPYTEFIDYLDRIKNKLKEDLTFEEIDNIIWYCYKNDSVRIAVATALSKR